MEKDESCTRRVSCEIEGGTRKIKGKESEGRERRGRDVGREEGHILQPKNHYAHAHQDQ